MIDVELMKPGIYVHKETSFLCEVYRKIHPTVISALDGNAPADWYGYYIRSDMRREFSFMPYDYNDAFEYLGNL